MIISIFGGINLFLRLFVGDSHRIMVVSENYFHVGAARDVFRATVRLKIEWNESVSTSI